MSTKISPLSSTIQTIALFLIPVFAGYYHQIACIFKLPCLYHVAERFYCCYEASRSMALYQLAFLFY